MSARYTSVADLAERLAVDTGQLDAARREVDARGMECVFGPAEAADLAFYAGAKPVLQHRVAPADVERTCARFVAMGYFAEGAVRHTLPPQDTRAEPALAALDTGAAEDAAFLRDSDEASAWPAAAETVDLVLGAPKPESEPTPESAPVGGLDRAFAKDPPEDAEHLVYVAATRARARECASGDQDDAERVGRLLGYPTCCVAAFVASAGDPIRAALARTTMYHPRLNVLDRAIFHYVPWSPCAFDCRASIAWANRIARIILTRHDAALTGPWNGRRTHHLPGCSHERFIRHVDAALSAHRLMLFDDVQLSIVGRRDGDRITIQRSWPTGRDRHPTQRVGKLAAEAIARSLAAVREARVLSVREHTLWLDDAPLLETPGLWLGAFGDLTERPG
jgi:hypothetical protein